MDRRFWVLGCVFALLAVAAGAFGAHGLRDRLPQSLLAIFETAARYQMYHALALLFTAQLHAVLPGRLTRGAGWLFTAGILLFSGSLYVLSLTGVTWLGAITPLGGVAFLAAWAFLAFAALRR